MYQLAPHKFFLKKAKKFVKNNYQNELKLKKTLKLLSENPFNLFLKTHHAGHRLTGKKFSSRVSGDIRVIWGFTLENKSQILLIDLGGHSGKNKVYR